MQNDSKYIPGVYNYCDRWCERCPFAMRCRNFAMELAGDDLDGDEFADQYGFPRDSDGSAKIALIAIDRSIGAWNVLRKLLPDQQQAVVGFLRMLSRLRHDTEAAFPNARAFVRPGFDEV